MSSSTATDSPVLGRQAPRLLFALMVVCLGSLIGPLDTSVNVAFPLITSSFGLQIRDIQWVVASYIVAQSGLTLAFGQLGDLYGHRRIFRWGMAACVVTHALCALAPTYSLLIVSRVLQGVAVGLAMACGPALATLLFPPALRRQILALYVMLLGAGIALGPLMGGLLLDAGGWPAVFWFRVPLSLLVVLLSLAIPEPDMPRRSGVRFDAAGALWLTLSLASLVLMINLVRRGDLLALWALPTALLLLFFLRSFVRQEARVAQPILHPRYLGDPLFQRLQVYSVLLNLSGFAIFLLLPYALHAQLGRPAWTIGWMLAVSPAGAVLAGFVGARRSQDWSAQGLMRTGMWGLALGLSLIGLSLPLQALPLIALALFIMGLGVGCFQLGFMDLCTAMLPPAERGVAGSLLNVTRVTGGVLGAAVITWLFDGWRLVLAALPPFAATFVTLGLDMAVLAWSFRVRPPAPPGPSAIA